MLFMEPSNYIDFIKIIGKKKAFIWDFDGCLADTEPLHHRAYKAAFAAYDYSLEMDLGAYNHCFTHRGGGVEQVIKTANLSCSPESIYEIKTFIYRNLIKHVGGFFYKENIEIIKYMKKMNVKIAIASNSAYEDIFSIVELEGVYECFDEIVGKKDGLRKKPFPDIFFNTLNKLSVKPEEALVFEDSERGLEAAAAAGIDAVWVQTNANILEKINAFYLSRLNHAQILSVFKEIINND